MSITVPSDLELLDANALIGRVGMEKGPLHTLLRRINWLWTTYTPAVCNFVPLQGTSNNSVVFRVPFPASADALNYQPVLVILTDTTGNVDVTIKQSATLGTFTAVTGWNPKTLSCNATDANIFWAEDSFPVPATGEFLEITVDHQTGGANVQLAAFMAYPQPLETGAASATTIATKFASGQADSGVWFYEDAHLAQATAAVHTEYMNRPVRAVAALAADRVQCVGSFVQNTSYDRGFALSTGYVSRTFYRSRLYLPGNVGSAQVTVKLAAREGGTGGKVTVGQVGAPGDSWHTFTVPKTDVTAQTATITVWGERPEIVGIAHIDSRSDVLYMVLEWTPDFASDYEPAGSERLVSAPAPPPLISDLGVLADLTLRLGAYNYAPTATTFYAGHYSASNYGGGTFTSDNVAYAFQRCPPGVYGMRGTFTRASNGEGGDMPDTETAAQPGSAAAVQSVTIECPNDGGDEAPWSADTASVFTYDSSAEYAASGSGDHPYRIGGDREAKDMLVVLKQASGLSGQWLTVDDLSTV